MLLAYAYLQGYNYVSDKGGFSMTKNDILRKLTSRKLWASVASFVSMLLIFLNYSDSTATQISALIMAGASVIGYVIGEGLADGGNKKIEG